MHGKVNGKTTMTLRGYEPGEVLEIDLPTGQRLRFKRTASPNGAHEWSSSDRQAISSDSLEWLAAAVDG